MIKDLDRVQCYNCENIHYWKDRNQVYDDGQTIYLCPTCDEESFFLGPLSIKEIKNGKEETEQK
jgi:NAD-dependent SIR2 family protein deacetylase